MRANHPVMVRRGCTVVVALFVALFALYLWFFTRYFEWPGNLIAAGFGAVFGAVGIGAVGHILWAWRDTRAFARAGRAEAPADGQLIAVAGPIRPLGSPLTSPVSGAPCVAYEYEVFKDLPGGPRRSASREVDLAGFAMAACAIDAAYGSVQLLGFPLLDEFPQSREHGPGARTRVERYAATTEFEPMHGLSALKTVSELDDALADADGIVRKDFRLNDDAVPFDSRTIGERAVRPGEQVCALGLYDAGKRALVSKGTTINRLWPGTPARVRRGIVATAGSQAKLGLTFFVVTHCMLGLAFYLSETRHSREPAERQASAIRSAVQANDVAALERAVRRGADPNARDTFGDVVLFEVREPAMAAALIRLGADVDVRDRRDGETPLIRAARLGDVPLVQVLLASGASAGATSLTGRTALDEAAREGHDEVVALLRAAERSAGVERDPK
jgi:Ankyrin repeats (3 copies)